MSPSYNHGYFQLNLGIALRKLAKYSVVTAVTIDIQGKPYIPDVLVYPPRPTDVSEDIIKMTEMPLLAIEILSPTQGTLEISRKFKIYFAAGIKSCWLVLPIACAVNVYSASNQFKTFVANDVIDEVLNIRLPIAEIFA